MVEFRELKAEAADPTYRSCILRLCLTLGDDYCDQEYFHKLSCHFANSSLFISFVRAYVVASEV